MNLVLSLAVITLGNIIDFASTRYGQAHGCVERNPAVNAFGLVPTKILSTVALGALAIRNPGSAMTLAAMSFVVHAAVGASNVRQARIMIARRVG